MLYQILPATPDDWPAIERIYRAGIRTGHATFQSEDEIPDGASWFAGKIADLIFKAVDSETMLGWIALSRGSSRAVYAGVAEVSVYVDPAQQGNGIGAALLAYEISASEAAGIWTLHASIFPENVASIRLHQRHGFRILGTREKIGKMNGRWRDTVFMERRSKVVV